MRGDASEDGVARKQDGVAIEGALRNVSVGNRHANSGLPQCTAEVAHVDPVFERCFVNWDFLKQFSDDLALLGRLRARHELSYDDRRD